VFIFLISCFFLTFSVECVFCEKNMFYCMVEKFRVFFLQYAWMCAFLLFDLSPWLDTSMKIWFVCTMQL
jgi:hypothetical protein